MLAKIIQLPPRIRIPTKVVASISVACHGTRGWDDVGAPLSKGVADGASEYIPDMALSGRDRREVVLLPCLQDELAAVFRLPERPWGLALRGDAMGLKILHIVSIAFEGLDLKVVLPGHVIGQFCDAALDTAHAVLKCKSVVDSHADKLG